MKSNQIFLQAIVKKSNMGIHLLRFNPIRMEGELFGEIMAHKSF